MTEPHAITTAPAISLTELEFRLLNSFQRDFPLLPRPFAALAGTLGTDEATVLNTLRRLKQSGVVSRAGAVFRPNVIGASTLAALAVPPDRIEQVARFISKRPEVNHNYEREHHFNLWFVATAPSTEALRASLKEIEDACRCEPLLFLPMIEDYHIDLGFDLDARTLATKQRVRTPVIPRARRRMASLSPSEQILVATLQHGLPLVERPFSCLGQPEEQAISTIACWLKEGVIKRFGVIVRHHELGYTANAMSVWDIPDTLVSDIGKRMAGTGRVTLCYRRLRQLPDWPYNLFCMIHGKDREDVAIRVAELNDLLGLAAYPHTVLFSRRRFKQRGAHYAFRPEATHG